MVNALKRLMQLSAFGPRSPASSQPEFRPTFAGRRRSRLRAPVSRHPDRKIGYYVNPGDWPIALGEADISADDAIDVLQHAFTPDNWEETKRSLRSTSVEDWPIASSIDEFRKPSGGNRPD